MITTTQNPESKSTAVKTKPIHELRLGSIKAAILKNEINGAIHYNTTFTRLYKENDQWKSTDSFGRDDLLLLAKVADQAHSWICELPRSKES